MNVIRSNRFVTVRAVDFISVLQGDLLEPSLTLVSGADNHVVRFFPVLPFDVTKVSLVSRIEHQKLSLLRAGHGRSAFYCSHFYHRLSSFFVL